MGKRDKLFQAWGNRKQIIEGIKNSIMKDELVEEVYQQRKAVCDVCPQKGDKCLVPGTGPCCNACGCSLEYKLRSLSSSCGDEEKPKWLPIMREREEDDLNRLT